MEGKGERQNACAADYDSTFPLPSCGAVTRAQAGTLTLRRLSGMETTFRSVRFASLSRTCESNRGVLDTWRADGSPQNAAAIPLPMPHDCHSAEQL